MRELEHTSLTMEELVLANKAVLKDHAHENVAISSVTEGVLTRLLKARGIIEGLASLPASLPKVSQRLQPHVWISRSEIEESKELLTRLELDVKNGTSIDSFFMDVQSLASSKPMTLKVEDDGGGSFKLTGVPDLAILESGLDDTVIAPFLTHVLSLTGKRKKKLERLKPTGK